MNLNLETLFNVKNKTAVVTGGSRGIGAMITEGFLANGCKVYITARKKEALEDKAEELTKKYNIDCNVANTIWKEFLTLPSHADLTNEEVDFVIFHLKNFYNNSM